MTKYSIIVPTKNRNDTLAHCLQSIHDILRFDDFEVIIHHSGLNDEAKEIVENFNNPHFHYYYSPEPLGMVENWESALKKSKGEWVIYLGDDDGLLPNFFETLEVITGQYRGFEIISWEPVSYYWGNYELDVHKDNLYANVYLENIKILNSKKKLKQFFYHQIKYNELPCQYVNSIINKSLIKKVIDCFGSYNQYLSPDVSAGMINCCFTDYYIKIPIPLTISGASSHSTGYKFSASNEKRQDAKMSSGINMKYTEPFDAVGPCFELAIAAEAETMRSRFLQLGIDLPNQSFESLVNTIMSRIGSVHPQLYERYVEDLVEFCDKIKFDTEDFIIPNTDEYIDKRRGKYNLYNKIYFIYNGREDNFSNVNEASKFIVKKIPPLEKYDIDKDITLDSLPSLKEVDYIPLFFKKYGNAEYFLNYGWHSPEYWGVWSNQKKATITIPLNDPLFTKDAYIILYFITPGFKKIPLTVSINDVIRFSGPVKSKALSFKVKINEIDSFKIDVQTDTSVLFNQKNLIIGIGIEKIILSSSPAAIDYSFMKFVFMQKIIFFLKNNQYLKNLITYLMGFIK